MMKKITFQKYQGCGNDFIMINNSLGEYNYLYNSPDIVKVLCDRHCGIGADLVITVASDANKKYDFIMDIFFGKSGLRGALCGNGARCSVIFAIAEKIVPSKSVQKGILLAADGPHRYSISNDMVTVEIPDIVANDIIQYSDIDYFIDVGSPHYLCFVPEIADVNVNEEGNKIRYDPMFDTVEKGKLPGTNVNFVEVLSETQFNIRTYERAVDGETQACGTGSVSAAIILAKIKMDIDAKVGKSCEKEFELIAKNNGGDLKISFLLKNNVVQNIKLTGPATKVYSGTYYAEKNIE